MRRHPHRGWLPWVVFHILTSLRGTADMLHRLQNLLWPSVHVALVTTCHTHLCRLLLVQVGRGAVSGRLLRVRGGRAGGRGGSGRHGAPLPGHGTCPHIRIVYVHASDCSPHETPHVWIRRPCCCSSSTEPPVAIFASTLCRCCPWAAASRRQRCSRYEHLSMTLPSPWSCRHHSPW